MATLKSASNKVVTQNRIAQLDTFGSDIEGFIQKESLSVIENILGDFILRVKENINAQSDMVVSGKIEDITLQVNGDSVSVMAYPYLLYQDKGVNGAKVKRYNTPYAYKTKMPPIDDIKEWIIKKGIQTDNVEGTAYGIARSIFNNGIKPKNIYSKEIPQMLNELNEQVSNFVGESTVTFIDINIGKNNK